MSLETLIPIITDAIEGIKGQNITVIDVKDQTNIADGFIIATATSNRQLNAIANHVVEKVKEAGFKPLGIEAEPNAEWVLVDLNDIIVHLMLPSAREFYDLESLWQQSSKARSQNEEKDPLEP